MAALRLEDVVLRDDADDGRLGGPILGHREVMEMLLHYRGDERRQCGLIVDGEHRGAHDLGNEPRNVPPLADHLRPKIRIGHDPKRTPLFVDDQNRPDVALAH